MATEREILPELKAISIYMERYAAESQEDAEVAHAQADALLISTCRLLAQGRSAKIQAEIDSLTKSYYKMIKWHA